MSPIEIRFLRNNNEKSRIVFDGKTVNFSDAGITLEVEAKSDNSGGTVVVRSDSVHHKLTIAEEGSLTISTRGEPIIRLRHVKEVDVKKWR